MGIYRKIFKIFSDLGYINRDMTVSMGSKGSYKAISEAALTEKIRPKLIENGLIVLPVGADVIKVEAGLTTIKFTYRIVDIEDEGFIQVESVGSGKSTGDKGAGMASTYAFKYLWLRMFALISGEDPDNKSDATHEKEEADARKVVQDRYIELKASLNNLMKDGFIKSQDDFNRITGAIEATRGKIELIQAGEAALENIRAGKLDPATVAR